MAPLNLSSKQICSDILLLYSEVLKRLEYQELPREQEEHFVGLTTKLHHHAASALWLAEGTRFPGAAGEPYTFDYSSLAVLARAVMETYASLYYLCIDPIDEDVRTFRLLYSHIQGLAIRQEISTSDPEIQELQLVEERRLDFLRQRVCETKKFKSLNQVQQQDVLKGKYRGIQKVQMIERAGFGPKTARILYGLSSDYVHSGYLSLMRTVRAVTPEAQKTGVDSSLIQIAVVLSLAISRLASMYTRVQTVVDADPRIADLIKEYCKRTDFFDFTYTFTSAAE